MASFFIRSPSTNSKTGVKRKENKEKSNKNRKKVHKNEEISSDSEVEGKQHHADVSSSEEDETAQEKRLRLTKQYLEELEREEQEKAATDDVKPSVISKRLREDILEQSGRLLKKVAHEFQCPKTDDIKILKGHQLSITCLTISPDHKYIYSGSKDCSIIKWNMDTGKKVHIIPGGRKGTEEKHIGHTAHVLCIAISSDSKFLVSGCRNKFIHVWDPHSMQHLHTFKGHKDAISGLTFRKGSHELYSASHDRSVKVWSLDEMSYIETLFGHQDSITAIDSLTRERAITSGGRDGSIRIWKIAEESQLIYHGHIGSIDCVRLINEENFVSGGDDGSLALWGVLKKKPLTIRTNAHGGEGDVNKNISGQSNWISAVAAFQNTDLIASGSKDGNIRFWQCGAAFRNLNPLFNITIAGFVNSLQFSTDGSILVAGVGMEHRLGRWWKVKEAKNAIYIIPLSRQAVS